SFTRTLQSQQFMQVHSPGLISARCSSHDGQVAAWKTSRSCFAVAGAPSSLAIILRASRMLRPSSAKSDTRVVFESPTICSQFWAISRYRWACRSLNWQLSRIQLPQRPCWTFAFAATPRRFALAHDAQDDNRPLVLVRISLREIEALAGALIVWSRPVGPF